MSYRIHKSAQKEYLSSIHWMIQHHYEQKTLARFIDEIETGIISIENSPYEFPHDPCGRPGWRFYGPTATFRYVIRYIEDIHGEPYIIAINSPYRNPGYWKNRKPK